MLFIGQKVVKSDQLHLKILESAHQLVNSLHVAKSQKKLDLTSAALMVATTLVQVDLHCDKSL